MEKNIRFKKLIYGVIVLFAMIYGFLSFENEDNYNEKLYKKNN